MNMNVFMKPKLMRHQWATFSASMVDALPVGKYALREKISITPEVRGTEYCSYKDLMILEQVNNMERSMLNSAIQMKIRELNKDKTRVILHSNNGVFGGAREHFLMIMDNNFEEAKMMASAKNLGELLAMGFDQIMIPVLVEGVPAELGATIPLPLNSTEEDFLNDHSYCSGFIDDATSLLSNVKQESIDNCFFY